MNAEEVNVYNMVLEVTQKKKIANSNALKNLLLVLFQLQVCGLT
jgi:hypothetical protein